MTNLDWKITNTQLNGIVINLPPLMRLVRGGFVVLGGGNASQKVCCNICLVCNGGIELGPRPN